MGTRARVCEHLNACVNEDGTAIDGGEATGCDLGPCTECGALCPSSTWTPEGALAAQDAEYRELGRKAHRTRETIRLYLAWAEGRGS
jgi:hypothetical protein